LLFIEICYVISIPEIGNRNDVTNQQATMSKNYYYDNSIKKYFVKFSPNLGWCSRSNFEHGSNLGCEGL